MNMKESAEELLQLGMNISKESSYGEYENAFNKIMKILTNWYETGKSTKNHINENEKKAEYNAGYKQGEQDTHDNYKLGIYS